MNKYNPPEKIEFILDEFLSERGYLSVCKEYDVISQWASIVGEKIASISECGRIDNGVLYVKVYSASWRNEIVYLKKEIIEKIELLTGCTIIKEIIFY